jgi:CHAD domain-containing protein
MSAEPIFGPVDRAAFALGSALVAWSRRRARRRTQTRAAQRSALPDARELHALRLEAQRVRSAQEAARDRAPHQLFWR